eukprot:UN26933
MIETIVTNGGTVVLPHNSDLLTEPDFLTLLDEPVRATMEYGQCIDNVLSKDYATDKNGLHIMDNGQNKENYNETITGLAANGCSSNIVIFFLT